MGAMKEFVLDVCYMHRDGFTDEEIANKYNVSIAYVEETIKMYYPWLIR